MPLSRADRQGPAYRALVLGLTDLFVGASAIALLLIVATKQTVVPVRIPQTDYPGALPPGRRGLGA